MISKQFSRLLSRRCLKYQSASVRHHNFDGETPSKTQLSLIIREDQSHVYITSYSNYGVRLSSGLAILGPCAVFPRAFLHWNVFSPENITPESLSLFCMLEPKLDILIIGKGDWDAKVDIGVIKYLRSKKINVEILPTEHACSTFNFLNSERRAVAAAIIPPKNMPNEYEDDDSLSKLKLDDIDNAKENYLHEVDTMVESLKGQNIFSVIAKHRRSLKQGSEKSRQDDDTERKTDIKKDPKK